MRITASIRSLYSAPVASRAGRASVRGLVTSLITASTLLSAAFAGSPVKADLLSQKCDQFLAQTAHRSTGRRVSVIIRLDGELAAPDQNALRELGVDVYRHLPVIHSIAASVPKHNLSRLAELKFVARLSLDAAVKKCDEFTVGSSRADVAYSSYGLTGQGVGVAVVDSGISVHEDLTKPGLLGTFLLSQNRILKSVNFVATDTTTSDLCGHGTHVAGIIGGNGTASSGLLATRTFYGIARKVNLVSVRVLDRVGEGDVSTAIAGIQWVINNRTTYNIRVLNLSLGHPVGESYTTDPLCQAVESAWNAGIVVVCAAGNDGRASATQTAGAPNEGWGTAYGSINSPGNDPYVITVGATKSMDGNRAHDRIATYSGRGPSRLDIVLKPDIIAPGNHVISTLADGSYFDTDHNTNVVSGLVYLLNGITTGSSDRYFYLSGTSMATPVVAGGAALILQKYPNLSPDTIKARMMLSADKWLDPSGVTDPCTYGAGYLNIPAALNSTVVATQPAMSPTLSEDANGNVYINMDRAIWGSRALWGTGVTDLRAVWGTQSLWDSSTNLLSASRAVWGTSVWSDRAVWGTTTSYVDLSSRVFTGE
ncbi:MAG TPA: S8 family peptidase [Chthonomonadaceae bacterium]|nr:S8 family peptidase [Chthonomonadaceae bacterium]